VSRAAPVALGVAGLGLAVSGRRRRAEKPLGRVTGRLATWVPHQPVGVSARLLVRLWASPMTLVGLAVGAASGVAPRVRDGVLLFAPARGLTGRVIRRRGFAATGLGHVIVSVVEPTPGLWAHEVVHVRQAERFGPLMIPLYLGLLARHGYAGHPLEMAARLGAAATPSPT
jgi:hypothetical protein